MVYLHLSLHVINGEIIVAMFCRWWKSKKEMKPQRKDQK